MSLPEFEQLADKLKEHTKFLYFHLMGEPLLHPQLPEFLDTAGEKGFRAILTTNGTLLSEKHHIIEKAALHRVNISLQSYEANSEVQSLDSYIAACADFAKSLSAAGKLCSMRLWNGGGQEKLNGRIIGLLKGHFPESWQQGQRNEVLHKGIFLEKGEMFDWPDMKAQEREGGCFCYGLRDHVGVLCDGTVVPCCLDHEGDIALGNLFEQSLDEIISSPRAKRIYDGFSRRQAAEELCRKCGYAGRFG